MSESSNPSGKQAEWGSMILVHLLDINASNVYAVAEKISKQNTINSQEAYFLLQFLSCKLAHTWRYMYVFYLNFLLGLRMIWLKLTFCVILLCLYRELDVSETFLCPAAPLKVGAGHCFWWWGWLPCPVPPGTSHALCVQWVYGRVYRLQPWRHSWRIPADELSCQLMWCHCPSCPGSWRHNMDWWRGFAWWTWGYGQNLA